MYEPKIAVIIPTLDNDDKLMLTVNSILNTMDMNNAKIIILDQNEIEEYSDEKRIFYETAASQYHSHDNEKVIVRVMPKDYPVTEVRNKGIEIAHKERIQYCLMMNDNIKFTESMNKIYEVIPYMTRFTMLGFEVEGANRVYRLARDNGIYKHESVDTSKCITCKKKIVIFHCNMVNDFFLATTSSLRSVRWDFEEKNKEDFFWNYCNMKYRIGFTNYLSAKLI